MNNFRRNKANTNMSRHPGSSHLNSRERIGKFNSTDGFHPRQRVVAHELQRPLGRNPNREVISRNFDLDMPAAASSGKRSSRIRKKNRGWKKFALRSCAGMAVLVLLVGGYLFGKGYLNARQIFSGGGNGIFDNNVDPNRLRGEGDGRVNILLLGKGGAGHEGADLTDTLMIASIDPIHKEAALLSVPRDLYIRSAQGYTKINSVYANAKSAVLNSRDSDKSRAEAAGLSAIDRVMEDHMGIPIHYHAMIDFSGFERSVNEVGGITVNVKEPIYENMLINGSHYVLDVKIGPQDFDGTRALAYSRSRLQSTRGDFDRGDRQRLILMGLKDKALSIGTFSNPKKVSGLMDALGSSAQSNLSLNEVMRVYEIAKEIDSSKITSLSLADPDKSYVRTATIDGQSVVIPNAGANDYTEIRNYVRSALKDGFIRKEQPVVAVYNGTDITGLAARRASDLQSYGYNISITADSPVKGFENTVLVDLRDGAKKYTKHYLEQRLKVKAVSKLPDNITIEPGEADFVIILGQSESNNN